MKNFFVNIPSNDKEVLNEFEIVKKFKSHNVIKERIDIYRDFAINLLYYLYETYLGKEYIHTETDTKGHFNWCFNKVLEEFEEEEISFYGNDEIYEYFYGYYLAQFYTIPNMLPISHHQKLWEDIFDYSKPNKSKKNFEILLEIYNMFEKSIVEKHKDIQIL